MLARSFLALLLLCDVSFAAENKPPQQSGDQAAQSDATNCDRLAGHLDMNGHGVGIAFEKIDPTAAIPACVAALKINPNEPHLIYNLGRARDAAKDYQAAMALYLRAADLGNTWGMLNVASLYRMGTGAEHDEAKAVEWYQKAADLGDPVGMAAVGSSYYFGRGNPRDFEKAFYWTKKAADLGFVAAMYDTGIQFLKGQGVALDYPKAREWFEKAADLGDSRSMYNLGVMYFQGMGSQTDYAQAMLWWRKAADLGDAKALGMIADLLGSKTAFLGISKDANLASDEAIKSLKLHDNETLESLLIHWDGWTDDFRKAFQQRLKDNGLYSGATDGIWTPELRAAIQKLAGQYYAPAVPG